MRIKQNMTPKDRWTVIFLFCVSLMFAAFMVKQINSYLWDTLYATVFVAAFPILAAFFLYFGGLKLGAEVKLLFAFWVWFLISRILNGSEAFTNEFATWVGFGMFFVTCAAGLMASAEQRRRLLNWVGGIACGYYTALAVTSVVCAVMRISILNPITQGQICAMHNFGFYRLIVLDNNPNIGALWFFEVFFLLVYFFFSCRKKLWRIPIVFAAAANYFAMMLTYCRSIKIGFSVCIAMLTMLLAMRYLPLKKHWQKAATVVLATVLFIPLAYKSFDGADYIFNSAREAVAAAENESSTEPVEVATPAPSTLSATMTPVSNNAEATPETDAYGDTRDLGKSILSLSNRVPIYESAFITLKEEPIRLLRGCYWEDIMSIAKPMLKQHNVHFHNFLLQTLIYTGLVGFMLALAYCVLLVVRMVRYFFSEDERAGFSEKLLTLPLTGIMLHSMLEPILFNAVDFGSLAFFLIAGVFLGYSHELHPPKQKN